MIEQTPPQNQPHDKDNKPREKPEDDWVADVKRWYDERARGVDVAGRQEMLKGLRQEWS